MKVKYSINIPSHWKNIKCPFFRSDNYNSISCEGCLEKTSLRHTFKSRFIKDDWQEKYCMKISKCRECPIYRIADNKYSDES
ncbi:MAG: hypothetical protein IJR70_03590 [Eubacterium sp.]|nr:hypothetical protein [Eubacterium sp.]